MAETVFIPPDAGSHDDSGTNRFADDGSRGERTTVVEDVDEIAVSDIARSGVGKTDFQLWLGGGSAEGIDFDERGVQEMRRRRRQQLQRKLLSQLRRGGG